MGERSLSLRLSWLVVLAVLVWLYLAPGADDSSNPERRSSTSALFDQEAPVADIASALPCDVPLTWRIGDIDDRFDLSAADVEAAVREAAESWEEVAGRSLFSHDRVEGFPINLVFDERQRAIVEQRRRDRQIDRSRTEIETRRSELLDLGREIERERARHEERVRALERRVATHNEKVSRWNELGSIPAEVREEIREEREEIDAERTALTARAEELRTRSRRLADAEERLQRDIDEHNRRHGRVDRTSPIPVEAGTYSEHARLRSGRVLSVENRQIEIYMVPDGAALTRVAAHELGHALGLGHAAEPTAVMGEVYDFPPGGSDLEMQPGDLDLLRSRCPELLEDRG